MFISVFDIFKIGVGPSSSHTMGPMTAAAAFLKAVRDGGAAFDPATLTGLEAQLYGSLAFTGKGHATDRAVILGLMGFEPASLDADAAEAITALDGKEFEGRALRINKAEPKKPAARRW